ncbi:hypothetical protein EIP86_003003 [Pleurotus ostreatoroseus]|nr:hypothetical protein EIP86_003003 [Pleurotus ostreatoroseus]
MAIWQIQLLVDVTLKELLERMSEDPSAALSLVPQARTSRVLRHRWVRGKVEFHIRWAAGGTIWEPYAEYKDLQVLDEFLELIGVRHWRALPRRHAPRTGPFIPEADAAGHAMSVGPLGPVAVSTWV